MYKYFDKKVISCNDNITDLYDKGYIFVRIAKGVMEKIQGVRVDINKFTLSSENKRILRKTENLDFKIKSLPYVDYTYEIQKMGSQFYKEKFGNGVFSAYKIKEIFTKKDNLNFNYVFEFKENKKNIGFVISFINKDIIHYSYPFYALEKTNKNIGIGMMTMVIDFAKKNNIKYVYLGSVYKKESLYKLQFKGVEWFDGNTWRDDLDTLKSQFV